MKQKQKKPKERKKLDVSSISSISSNIPSNFNQSSSAASEESSKIIKSDTASTLDKQTLLGSIKFSLKSVNKDLEHWKKIKDAKEIEKKKQDEILAVAVAEEKARIEAKVKADSERIEAMNAAAAAAEAAATQRASSQQREQIPNQPVLNKSNTPSDDNSEEKRKDKWLDYKKIACLLCQRQFKTVDILHKHCDQSDLHKKNLQIQEFKAIHKEQREAAQVIRKENCISVGYWLPIRTVITVRPLVTIV